MGIEEHWGCYLSASLFSITHGPRWGQSPLLEKVFRTNLGVMMPPTSSFLPLCRTDISSQLNSLVENSCKPFSRHELIILFPNCSKMCREGEPAFSWEMLKMKTPCLCAGSRNYGRLFAEHLFWSRDILLPLDLKELGFLCSWNPCAWEINSSLAQGCPEFCIWVKQGYYLQSLLLTWPCVKCWSTTLLTRNVLAIRFIHWLCKQGV